MKKNLYLHLGMHKTASTSLQVALYKNQDKLREIGYLYPVAGRPENARFGHHLVAWSFVANSEWIPEVKGVRESVDKNLILKELLDEIDKSGCDNIILSSEEFDILSDSEFESVFQFFSEFNIIPVLYIRNTIDFIESSYKTSVLYSGYAKSIDEFFANQRSRLDTFQFVSKLFYLSNKQLILKDYEAVKESNDLITDFLCSLSIDKNHLEYSDNTKENKSPPSDIIEIVRFFNVKGVDYQVVGKMIEKLMQLSTGQKVHLFSKEEVELRDKKFLSDSEKLARFYESQERTFVLSKKFMERNGDRYLEGNLVKSILFVINSFDELITEIKEGK
ncbi:hypothetical protein NO989_16795 [Alteromonas sp. DY56-G5]|uniref:hypothetical protein n=1 Tax=Alteromonas sp. DY56-G5 TaxID=2967128 RepID=UPI00352B22E5